MDERYTLDEARRKLARDECAAHGHDYDIIVEQGTNAPAAIVCSRCGEAWTVGQDRTAVVREVVEALRSWAEDCPPTHSPVGAIQAADFIEQSLIEP